MIIVSVLILAVAFSDCFADEPTYKIETRRSDDRVEVKSDSDKSVFIVRSPAGISHATIQRTKERWPNSVVIQLRLQGLESLKLLTDKDKLEASVSSQSGEVRLWKEGREDLPLDSKSAYWMEIRVLGSDDKPTTAIPLRDGCFEMLLPKKFFVGNPKSIKVEWIDFYRN